MSKPRIHLFFGNNTKASLEAITSWRVLFLSKYGVSTCHILEVDELTLPEFTSSFSSLLTSQSLFAEPTLVVVKRVTSLDTKKTPAGSEAFIKLVQENQAQIGDWLTLAVWIDQDLPEGHCLLKSFEIWKAEGKAAYKRLSIPSTSQIGRFAGRFYEERGFELLPEAAQWLVGEYRKLEQAERLRKRLKMDELLLEDERSWWLESVLEGGLLRAEGKTISLKSLEIGHLQLAAPVSVFEVVKLFRMQQWSKVRSLLREWEDCDESNYFALYAVLRQQLSRFEPNWTSEQKEHLKILLADIEVIAKNFSLKQAWLAEMLIIRSEQAFHHKFDVIIPARKLWMAHMQRT